MQAFRISITSSGSFHTVIACKLFGNWSPVIHTFLSEPYHASFQSNVPCKLCGKSSPTTGYCAAPLLPPIFLPLAAFFCSAKPVSIKEMPIHASCVNQQTCLPPPPSPLQPLTSPVLQCQGRPPICRHHAAQFLCAAETERRGRGRHAVQTPGVAAFAYVSFGVAKLVAGTKLLSNVKRIWPDSRRKITGSLLVS